MDDQRRRPDAKSSALLKYKFESTHASLPEHLLTLTSGKWKLTSTVYPRLIFRAAGKLLIILILEYPKVTFRKLRHYMSHLPRIDVLCSLDAPLHRTYIEPLCLRIHSSRKMADSLLTQRFIRPSYISFFQIPCRHRMTDQIDLHVCLILT